MNKVVVCTYTVGIITHRIRAKNRFERDEEKQKCSSLLTNLVYNQTDRTQFILYTYIIYNSPHEVKSPQKGEEKMRHGGISDTSFIL
jgi:hypothetical protein